MPEMAAVDCRDAFFDALYDLARKDPGVIFITADMGAFSLERFKKDLPRQYLNVGVAEQNMVSVAAGLALGGKKVFIYSIVPFVTLRCYEQIKVDLCCMKLPVTVVGIGAGVMYGGDGPTHHGLQDVAVMRALPRMTIFNPSDAALTHASARLAYAQNGPVYVRIEKGRLPVLYPDNGADFSEGVALLRAGRDVTIMATGLMVHHAAAAAGLLAESGISAGVVDVYRLKPLNETALLAAATEARRVVTLEEHSLIGGLGSAVCDLLADRGCQVPLKRLAWPDEHCVEMSSREHIHGVYRMTPPEIATRIRRWMEKTAV